MSDADIALQGVQIRPALATDAPAIARVHVDGWRWAYRAILPQTFLDSLSVESRTRLWLNAVEAQQPHSLTHVAVRDDRIVGFCSCGPTRDDNAPLSCGEISAIYVDLADTRQGIGRQLLDAALEHLAHHQFHDATLWVLDTNEIGQRFYERCGWVPDGATKTDVIGSSEVREVRYHLTIPGR